MTTTKSEKPIWLIILSDGQFVQVNVSHSGALTWRRQLAKGKEKGPTGKPLHLVAWAPARSEDIVQVWEDYLAPHRAPNLINGHLIIGTWFFDGPGLRQLLEDRETTTPYEYD
jgi:hypothetical protein